MIYGVGIAHGDACHRRPGELGFERHHTLRIGCGIRGSFACELECARNMRHVFPAERIGRGIGLGVVVTIRHSESALRNPGDVVICVLRISAGTKIEERGDAFPLKCADLRNECGSSPDRGDAAQTCADRTYALSLCGS